MKVYLTTYYDPEKKELNDTEVLSDLNHAASLYEDGAVIECRILLQRIIKAIKKFEQEYDLIEFKKVSEDSVKCRDCKYLVKEFTPNGRVRLEWCSNRDINVITIDDPDNNTCGRGEKW